MSGKSTLNPAAAPRSGGVSDFDQILPPSVISTPSSSGDKTFGHNFNRHVNFTGHFARRAMPLHPDLTRWAFVGARVFCVNVLLVWRRKGKKSSIASHTSWQESGLSPQKKWMSAVDDVAMADGQVTLCHGNRTDYWLPPSTASAPRISPATVSVWSAFN